MKENKIAFLSGRLSGTKTLENELESIENPDLYESFLKEFINLKFKISDTNDVIYINDDEDFKNQLKNIEESNYISLCTNNKFSRMYITTDVKKTYILRINKISTMLISDFVSKEKTIKFSLNSFNIFKWCNKKNIDIRNVYDIPTYIKILTNNVEFGKSFDYYIEKYTDKKLLEDDEKNYVIIGNFIYEFGKYLEKYIDKFDIGSICRIINENTYYESIKANSDGEVEVKFSYLELDKVIEDIINNVKSEFSDKLYVVSPLGRIALKYFQNEDELLKEIYNEDIETLILNELYNNNIYAKLLGNNLYITKCKFKNLERIFSLITSIFSDVFYRLFEKKIRIKIECIIEE